jgi:acyl phosphate:glycerol-3-phosphate acyltransferase
MTEALVVAGGYLVGSMPFGYWVVRLLRGEDVRGRGSGNIGATNVWRVYGRRYGIPVMLLDVAKGFVPALVGVLESGDLLGVLAGGAAMAGHWRPLFLGFRKGGKTVATAGGVFWAVAPLVALAGAAIWGVLFIVFRYSSVASMGAAAALPLVAWAVGEPWPVIAFGALAAGVVVVLHRGNIRRLREGTESRFHFRRTARA